LVRLPESIRGVLERLVKDLSMQEPISSVGLFGSWGRGDAVPTSDVDLLIVDARDFNYEYVERLEFEGLLVDLDYIPKKWIKGAMPPEIDQKLYEVGVLYDRDWSLTHMQNWMSKTYRKVERVDIRTEGYVVESDMYLSRATSALDRGDFQSARIFATMGVESMLKVLIDVNLLPFSNSHFIQVLEEAAKRGRMPEIFVSYLTAARLFRIDQHEAERKLSLLRSIWEDITSFMKEHASTVDSLHFKIRTGLRYYAKPAFLAGMIARSQAIITTKAFAEAAHYVLRVLIEMVENYTWMLAAEEKVRLDYTTLFHSLRQLEKQHMQVYGYAVDALNLEDADRDEAEKAVKFGREMNLNLRQRRRELIRTCVKSS
jgi:predicted nucleotidyltransferase